jgi:hypothetical protein
MATMATGGHRASVPTPVGPTGTPDPLNHLGWPYAR